MKRENHPRGGLLRGRGPRLLLAQALLLATAALAACSTADEQSPWALLDASGNHPAGWSTLHPGFTSGQGGLCLPCHGDDLRGGISKVSCFSLLLGGRTCHPNGPAFHPASWLDKAALHGSGFHATAYSNDSRVRGIFSCADCHTPPPFNGAGGKCRICHFGTGGAKVPAGSSYSHGDTGASHQAFAGTQRAVCVLCHEIDNRFGHPPFCHNCHEIHPAGWSAASAHGAAAKAAPGSMTGFPSCQTCHATGLDGGRSGVTCLSVSSCHLVASPHPGPGFWGGHTGTNGGNAMVCAICHRSNPGTAGCFNNTLCHANPA